MRRRRAASAASRGRVDVWRRGAATDDRKGSFPLCRLEAQKRSARGNEFLASVPSSADSHRGVARPSSARWWEVYSCPESYDDAHARLETLRSARLSTSAERERTCTSLARSPRGRFLRLQVAWGVRARLVPSPVCPHARLPRDLERHGLHLGRAVRPPHSRRDPPPAILSNEPGTWAHDTVSRRLRENILSRVFSDNAAMLAKDPAAEAALRALDAELSDAANATIRAIRPDGGPDVHAWNETLAAPWIGTSWLDTFWLASEFYFYRRILEALGYFGDGPCAQMDPFQRDKDAGLEACVGAVGALAPRLNEYASAPGVNGVLEGARLFLLVSLWGNRMDLSIWPAGAAAAAGDDGESSSSARAADAFNEALTAGERCLLHDDSRRRRRRAPRTRPRSRGTRRGQRGVRTVCDLALADALVCARDRTNADADADDVAARVTVTLHVKAHPVFVSGRDGEGRSRDCGRDVRLGRRRGGAHGSSLARSPDERRVGDYPAVRVVAAAAVLGASGGCSRVVGGGVGRDHQGRRELSSSAGRSSLESRRAVRGRGGVLSGAAVGPAHAQGGARVRDFAGAGGAGGGREPKGVDDERRIRVAQWLPRPARQADVASLAWSWDATRSTPRNATISRAFSWRSATRARHSRRDSRRRPFARPIPSASRVRQRHRRRAKNSTSSPTN